MRTVTFLSVLHGAAHELGLDPTTGDFSTTLAARLAGHCNLRLPEVWEDAFWPELMLTEERAYRDAWAIGDTYGLGDQVYYEDASAYYTSLQDANTGNQPDTATTFWEEVEEFDRYILLDQTGKTPLGEVKQISTKNPKTNRRYPGYIGFDLSDNGIQVSTRADVTVWVNFRRTVNLFTTTAWDSSVAYAVDDLVYVPSTGECYKSILAGTNQDPVTQTTYWTKVDFPKFLARFATLAIAAEELRSGEGQDSKAERKDAYADREIGRLNDRIFGQQRQATTAEAAIG
ncbi:hypothetical protein N9937_01575 [bacterium]|nr:hypothetical protein [bacterium]